MNILLLAGSPLESSRSSRLLDHVGEKLALLGHRHVLLQVPDIPAQALLHAKFGHPDLVAARAQVAPADPDKFGLGERLRDVCLDYPTLAIGRENAP